ncbi:B- and T-lymphocyte attenuator [Trichomycterus rosablanca]|uniref:B- and T-lymphocyte attenuator n=1 Tax=Trichomycterus rosablanca TaxID=2290929 RepID=UPI002F35E2FE
MCGELDVTSVMKGLVMILILSVTVDAQGFTSSCEPIVKLRKNTLYRTSSKRLLNISCPVVFCKEIPVIKWTKIDETNKMVPVEPTNQIITQEEFKIGFNHVIAYLIFKNISADDDGLYRCGISVSNFSLESHSINVTVSDSFMDSADGITASSLVTAPKHQPSFPDHASYIFICLGILGLVGIVMSVSFLFIFGCSRRSKTCKKKVRHTNALADSTLQCVTSCQTPPSSNISEFHECPSAQKMSKQRLTNHNASMDLLQSDQDSLYPANNRNSGGCSQQIVYATLEHLTPREPSALRQPSREDLTEYAAIRIS